MPSNRIPQGRIQNLQESFDKKADLFSVSAPLSLEKTSLNPSIELGGSSWYRKRMLPAIATLNARLPYTYVYSSGSYLYFPVASENSTIIDENQVVMYKGDIANMTFYTRADAKSTSALSKTASYHYGSILFGHIAEDGSFTPKLNAGFGNNGYGFRLAPSTTPSWFKRYGLDLCQMSSAAWSVLTASNATTSVPANSYAHISCRLYKDEETGLLAGDVTYTAESSDLSVTSIISTGQPDFDSLELNCAVFITSATTEYGLEDIRVEDADGNTVWLPYSVADTASLNLALGDSLQVSNSEVIVAPTLLDSKADSFSTVSPLIMEKESSTQECIEATSETTFKRKLMAPATANAASITISGYTGSSNSTISFPVKYDEGLDSYVLDESQCLVYKGPIKLGYKINLGQGSTPYFIFGHLEDTGIFQPYYIVNTESQISAPRGVINISSITSYTTSVATAGHTIATYSAYPGSNYLQTPSFDGRNYSVYSQMVITGDSYFSYKCYNSSGSSISYDSTSKGSAWVGTLTDSNINCIIFNTTAETAYNLDYFAVYDENNELIWNPVMVSENTILSVKAGSGVAVSGGQLVADLDEVTSSLTDEGKIETIGVRSASGEVVYDWYGTLEEYEAGVAAGTITSDMECKITDDDEAFIALIPAATPSTLGLVKPDGTSIIVSDDGTISSIGGSNGSSDSVGVATLETAGIVKPDGITITVDSEGKISAVIPEVDTSNFVETEDLATVATSGSYNDLTNKPTIPDAYTLPVATTTVLGGVKPDGVTVQIAADGTLSTVSDVTREEFTALQNEVGSISTLLDEIING